ncbi:MAG: site-specific DNA-methyltransferase [Acidobacteria bacterium]|nr:site-specific DNA-methyltransferase [Acidobacteriota bacterium]
MAERETNSIPRLPGASEPCVIVRDDSLRALAEYRDRTFQCCVTSPPYWGLRDYGVEGQLGVEMSLDDYLKKLVAVFREVYRVLTLDGTLWLNLGDSYTSGGRSWRQADKKYPVREMSYRAPTPEGLKPKDLVGVPWRLAFALQAEGWHLRSDIIWYKPNCFPESVKDRPTQSHEYLFLLSKSEKYYYDHEAVKEPTRGRNGLRNRRSVWAVNTESFKEAHFAVFPPALVEPCILAGSKPDSIVLDPFFGSGTVGEVSLRHGRRCVGIELNADYVEIARRRIQPLL